MKRHVKTTNFLFIKRVHKPKGSVLIKFVTTSENNRRSEEFVTEIYADQDIRVEMYPTRHRDQVKELPGAQFNWFARLLSSQQLVLERYHDEVRPGRQAIDCGSESDQPGLKNVKIKSPRACVSGTRHPPLAEFLGWLVCACSMMTLFFLNDSCEQHKSSNKMAGS